MSPLYDAVTQSHRFLLPVSLVNFVAGGALLWLDTAVAWRALGAMALLAGLAFLVEWLRGRDPRRHPVVQAVEQAPQTVHWVHVAVEPSTIGAPDRALLHVALQDGRHYTVATARPEQAEAAADAILTRCAAATRLGAVRDPSGPLPLPV